VNTSLQEEEEEEGKKKKKTEMQQLSKTIDQEFFNEENWKSR
jgi:hypothetical protein